MHGNTQRRKSFHLIYIYFFLAPSKRNRKYIPRPRPPETAPRRDSKRIENFILENLRLTFSYFGGRGIQRYL